MNTKDKMHLAMDQTIWNALAKIHILVPDKTVTNAPISCLYRPTNDINKIAYMTLDRYNRFIKKEGKEPSVYEKELIKYAIKANPGRVIKKLLPELDAKSVTTFVSHFTIIDGKFEIWKNVTEAYNTERINSCMTNCDMSFYELNGIKVLVLLTNKHRQIRGRALYWPEIYFPELKKTLPLIDRVFTVDGKDLYQFDKYALNNDCVIRTEYKHFVYKEEGFDDKIEYKLDYWEEKDIDFWPYLDTLYLFTKDGYLRNYINSEIEGKAVSCHLTDGSIPYNWGKVWSNYHDCYLEEENAIQLHGDYFDRNSEIVVRCPYCQRYEIKDYMISLYKKYKIENRVRAISSVFNGILLTERWSDGDRNTDKACSNCAGIITLGKFTGEGYLIEEDKDIITSYNGYTFHKGEAVKLTNGKYAYHKDPQLVKGEFGNYIDDKTKYFNFIKENVYERKSGKMEGLFRNSDYQLINELFGH